MILICFRRHVWCNFAGTLLRTEHCCEIAQPRRCIIRVLTRISTNYSTFWFAWKSFNLTIDMVSYLSEKWRKRIDVCLAVFTLLFLKKICNVELSFFLSLSTFRFVLTFCYWFRVTRGAQNRNQNKNVTVLAQKSARLCEVISKWRSLGGRRLLIKKCSEYSS